MQLETKFMRLPTPVTLGSRFGEWQVSWLGGWSKHRMYYLVMVVKVQCQDDEPNAQSPIAGAPKGRAGSRTRAGSKCLRPTESGDFYLHADAWAKRRAD